MIPIIGLLIAVYAVARLLQVPLEQSAHPRKVLLLFLISLPAIIAIAVMALGLLITSIDQHGIIGSALTK